MAMLVTANKTKIISGAIRLQSFSVFPRRLASHYDVLGLTPKATQNDIKTAYYNLSKIHHPDKSKDEESTKKFRAIKEAYEILGNIKLKKMYDKGLLVGNVNTTRVDYRPEPEPTDPTLKFYKSHSQRQVTPTMDGKTPIYDFDDWSRNHYSDLFNKSQIDKKHIKKKKVYRKEAHVAVNQEFALYALVSFIVLFFVLAINGQENYDVSESPKKTGQERDLDKSNKKTR